MPLSAPSVVAKEAERPMFSPINAPLVWSKPSPPYSSGMFAPINPSSAALATSSRDNFQSCFSSSSMRGTTSLSINCRVVSAIMRCSSVKSSGVKISSGVRSSIRNEPPLIIRRCSATADIVLISFKNPCYPWLIKSFQDPGSAHSTANTHRHHPVSPVAALQLSQNARRQLCASAAKRMAQRDRASVDVNFVGIETQRLDHRERLRSKRLIQLNHVDIVQR